MKEILKDKKKLAMILVAVGVVLVFAGSMIAYRTSHITINGETYARDITALDLNGTAQPEIDKIAELTDLESLDLRNTGLTATEYEQLRAALPDCVISWSVPFQGGYYEETATTVTVASLTMADVEMLDYLPNLQTVDATACRDYEILDALRARRPDCKIQYTVTISGSDFRENTTALTLETVDPGELEAALPWLPALETVTITGEAPGAEKMAALMAAFPEVCFNWNFEVMGIPANSLDTHLDLTGVQLENVDDLESMLPCFHALERVDIYDRTVTSEEIDAMAKRHPETRFVWTVNIGPLISVRTDITTFMPYKFGATVRDRDLKELKYCVDIICMDMGHMNITDYSYLAYMPNMQYLILADTRGNDFSALEGLTNLKYLELFVTAFSESYLLPSLTSLEDVNLSFTYITDFEPLKQMDHLQRLWLAGMQLDAAQQKSMNEALPNTKIHYPTTPSTAYGWRESPNYYAQRDLLGMHYMRD